MKRILALLLALLFIFTSCSVNVQKNIDVKKIDEAKKYYSKEDVKNYIIIYKKLPSNFITKKEAKNKGWKKEFRNLSDGLKGMCIGGDKFQNREKKLPIKKGRIYYECDIDYRGGKRNAKRIVFSNDGLIYYTNNHYKSFEKLYGE